MSDILVQIIFGWPFIIVSLLVSLIGLSTKRPWLLAASAILFAPFSYYLSGWPGVRGLAFTLPLFLAGAAYAIHKQKIWPAWLFTLPAFLVSGWIAFLVLTQQGPS